MREHAIAEFGAGVALGALIGLILGMSGSPVAGTVIGALVALLASFFGLRPTRTSHEDAATRLGRLMPSRMTGFGVGAVVALFCGLTMRTHGSLSPTPKEVTARWAEAAFSPEQARALAAYQLVGTFPAESRSGERKKDERDGEGQEQMHAAGPTTAATVLFSDDVDACNELAKPFKDAAAAVKAWKSYSAGWAAVAVQVEKTRRPANQMQALEAIRQQLCPSD